MSREVLGLFGESVVEPETRVIRLVQAQAVELAGLVEKSLNTPREQVKVLVDARSNSLVVTGAQMLCSEELKSRIQIGD